jgi:hypothetical protein
MKPTAAGSYVLLAPCFGTTGWQVLVFAGNGRCIFGSAHPTRAEAARERRRLIRSLGATNGRGK